jgi:quinol monooxygenase YgiN
MTVTVRAELRVRHGACDEFVQLAKAMADAAFSEPGTLRYDWYSSADPALFVVIEEYSDPDAALTHNQNCEQFLSRIAQLAEMTSAHLHGHLGPVLEEWVAQRSFAHAHPPLTGE